MLACPTHVEQRISTRNTYNSISFTLQNTNSVRLRINMLRNYMADENSTIVAITESHLNGTDTDSSIAVPGYTAFRQDRVFAAKGGLLLYIRQDLPSRVLTRFCHNEADFEMLVVETWVCNKKLVIVLVYRTNHFTVLPASVNMSSIIKEIANLVELCCNYCPNTYVLGDFNLPHGGQRNVLEKYFGRYEFTKLCC